MKRKSASQYKRDVETPLYVFSSSMASLMGARDPELCHFGVVHRSIYIGRRVRKRVCEVCVCVSVCDSLKPVPVDIFI